MRKPRRNDGPSADYKLRTLRLIEMGGLVLRRRGWRFGTTRIKQATVDRLVANGHAVIRGDRCVAPPATEVRP